MTTCRCCGGPVEAETADLSRYDRGFDAGAADRSWPAGRAYVGERRDGTTEDAGTGGDELAIWVEANVLACCNAAYDRAERTGLAEVSLFDLLHAIASGPTLAAWLAAYDIDRDLLRIEVEAGAANSLTATAPGFGPPQTSPEMKAALIGARSVAERRLAVSLSIGDVLTAILDNGDTEAGRLLASHVARERQRRRGGMRGWRADPFSGLGDLDPAMTVRPSNDTASSDWGKAGEGGSGSGATDTSAASSDGFASQGSDSLGFGVYASEVVRPTIGAGHSIYDRHHAHGRAWNGSNDDLYRPGEREPADGWQSSPASSSATTLDRLDLDSVRREMLSGQSLIETDVRTLTLQLDTLRVEVMARLDEQGLLLDEILGQLALLPRSGAAAAVASNEGAADDDDLELEAASAGLERGPVAVKPSVAVANTVEKSKGKPAAAGAATATVRADATASSAASTASGLASASSGGAAAKGAGREHYLTRAEIRAQMRRTSARRRDLRARTAQAASSAQNRRAASAASGAGQGQQRLVAVPRTGTEGHGRPDVRMGLPSQGSATAKSSDGRPIQPVKLRLKDGPDERLMRQADDDEADDIDGGQRAKRFYLSIDDDIVEAPSIGPRTAERLREHGVNRVRDLLAVKAQALSARMGVRHITAERITSWQHQARLVCTIPWLRGTHAQILVGSGYYAPHSIVTANRDALCTSILRFATTREGQSVLRSAPPPSLGKIMRWVEQAAMAELDRAA